MALATLTRKYVGSQAVAIPYGIADYLDACYTLGVKATYYDGSTRTPGAGSAHTVSRYQSGGVTEAVYGQGTTDALSVRWILAGAAGAKTPTMRSPDTWSTNTILAAFSKNSGAFNAWDNAAPFTSGQFFGYWKSHSTGSAGTVHMIEDEEGVYFLFALSAGGVGAAFIAPFIDPYTTGTPNAETDGRIYCLATSGTSAISTTFLSTAAAFLSHGTSNNNPHLGLIDPGAGTITVFRILLLPGAAWSTTTSYTARDGSTRLPVPAIFHADVTNYTVGLGRKVCSYPKKLACLIITDGSANIKGVTVGANTGTVNDAIILECS
jgi:hypothetical protein